MGLAGNVLYLELAAFLYEDSDQQQDVVVVVHDFLAEVLLREEHDVDQPTYYY